jgi:hypothetical protein
VLVSRLYRFADAVDLNCGCPQRYDTNKSPDCKADSAICIIPAGLNSPVLGGLCRKDMELV